MSNKENIKSILLKTFPSSWRVLKKTTDNQVNYYLLVACNPGEGSEITKTPYDLKGNNVFRVVKESVSKLTRFTGSMVAIPDFEKIKEKMILKANDRKTTSHVKVKEDYIHSLKDYFDDSHVDYVKFSEEKLIPLNIVDENNHENKSRVLLGKVENFLTEKKKETKNVN